MLDLVEANQAPTARCASPSCATAEGMWAGPSNGRPSDLIGLTADSKDWGEGVKLAYVREASPRCFQFTGPRSFRGR